MILRQPPNMCIVLIFRLKTRKFYAVYYFPHPIPGAERNAWRFLPGKLRDNGHDELKRAQAAALVLARDLRTLRHPIIGALSCPEENVLLESVIEVPWFVLELVVPPFGFGAKSLRETLEAGAQKVERKEKRLIIGPWGES